jgi:hypothetical protein
VTFGGRHLFVNAQITGALRVEIVDVEGRTIAPFSADRSVPTTGDGTKMMVTWDRGADLAPLAGRPVRFRFLLERGELFAFWVSPSTAGASHGYVAAGGPGLASTLDR